MDNLDIFEKKIKLNLLDTLNKTCPSYEKQFYSSYKFLSLIDNIDFKNNEDKEYLKKIVDFSLFLSINLLDLTIPFKKYLNISSTYYERFNSIKNLIIFLNEGYKKLFHFVENKRNISMWKSKIGIVIEKYFVEYKNEYDQLTNEIKNYENIHQNFILKTQRSVFLHYEGELIDYANEIKKIDVTEIITNTKDYILLTNKLQKFTHKVFEDFTKKHYYQKI